MPSLSLPSPFGPLTLWQEGDAITRLTWDAGPQDPTPLLQRAAAQLAEYFAGQRRGFDVPLATGTGRTGAFLQALCAIPFGETRRYGDLARDLGTSAQDVGRMCGMNRLPILIPCHRVLAAQGLGGFSAPGGIETKVALLRHEGAAGLLI
jgi:methylated-DNA-[protein]-cysteine S-methyltransferase